MYRVFCPYELNSGIFPLCFNLFMPARTQQLHLGVDQSN